MVDDLLFTLTETYPRIAFRISATWGSAECRGYLNDLLFDHRGDRSGFPPDVAAAILGILKQHDEDFPSFRPPKDPWDF